MSAEDRAARISAAHKRCQALQAEAEQAQRARADLVRDAFAHSDPVTALARTLGLSRARLYQIASGR